MANTLVTISNHLLRAGYQMTEWEHRIINLAAAQIEAGISVREEDWFVVEVSTMRDLFDVDSADLYRTIKKAGSRLYERSIDYRFSPDGKAITRGRQRWLSAIEYRDGYGALGLKWSSTVIPYLTELSKEFTQYQLADIVKLEGKWAPRIYQMLMSWRSVGKFEATIDELHFYLQTSDSYKNTGILMRSVIKPAIQELNEKLPDLNLNMGVRKSNKTITHVIFTFKASTMKRKAEHVASIDGKVQYLPSPNASKPSNREMVRKKLRDIEDTSWF